MSTLTAPRTTGTGTSRHPRVFSRPAPGRAMRRPVSRFRLLEPAGLPEMRAKVAEARADLVSEEQVRRVLELVRTGTPLPQVAATVDLAEGRVLDVVAGVGSRISQANKTGPKVSEVVYAVSGRQRPSARRKLVAVIPPGFEPAAGHGRDVTRSLAALLIADPAGDERPIGRWLADQSTILPVQYTHLVHWHFLAQRGTHTLADPLFCLDVQDVFVRAFDLLAAEFAGAVGAIGRILNQRLSPAELAKAADTARWLAPEVDRLAAAATAAAGGDAAAAARVPALLTHLHRIAEARPARYTPRSLGDISREQLRLIAARHGMSAADIPDATRTSRNINEYSQSVAAARAKVEAELAAQGAAA